LVEPSDRAQARAIAEQHWREMIDAAFGGNMERATALLERLDQRIAATAAAMPPDRGAAFLRIAEEERNLLFEEYGRNPDALKRRLGARVELPPERPRAHHHNSMADTVVRTAVRATVWEGVISIFRALRR
jgi:hypothetical protein